MDKKRPSSFAALYDSTEKQKNQTEDLPQDEECKIREVSIKQLEDTLATAITELTGEEYKCLIRAIRFEGGGKLSINLAVARQLKYS